MKTSIFSYSIRLTTILISIVLLSSCASMSGGDQLISVDSYPRGAPVFDKRGHLVDTTPMFVEQPRGMSAEYYVNEINEISIPCDYRWYESAGANTAVALFFTNPVPLLGVGIDLLSGAAWECPEKVALPVTPDNSFVFCQKYVVIVNSKHRSDVEKIKIRKYWFERNRDDSHSCMTLVTDDKTDNVVSIFGFSPDQDVKFSGDEDFIRDFSLRSKATSIIILKERNLESSPVLEVSEIDSHSTLVHKSTLKSPLGKTRVPISTIGSKIFRYLKLLTPNSVSIGAEVFAPFSDYTNTSFTLADLGKISTYLGRVSVEKISSRRALKKWDWNYGTSLFFHAARINQMLETDQSDGFTTNSDFSSESLEGYYFNYGLQHSISWKLAAIRGDFSIFTGYANFETLFKGVSKKTNTFNTVYELKFVNFLSNHLFSKGSIKISSMSDAIQIADSKARNVLIYNLEFGYLF